MPKPRLHQTGSFLLESLFAILIFAVGILGLIGLQLSAVKQSSDANYRSEAAMFANQLIGTMWASDRTPAALQSRFQAGGAGYLAWSNQVAAALPGITAAANLPEVSVDASDGATAGTVTIKVSWQAPGTEPHSHLVVAQIR